MEANETAIKAIEIKELPIYYILLAKIAKRMGQYTRCSSIIGEGISKNIFDEQAVLELIYLYLSIDKKENAKSLLHKLEAMPNAKTVLSLDKKKELENIIGIF